MSQDWLTKMTAALDLEPLDASQQDQLLKLTREVAHRAERVAVPPASFLLGMDVSRRMAEGASRDAAFRAALAALAATLPPASVNDASS